MAAGANPLLKHAWGISPGADHVWAQVAGMAPSLRPWERWFMVQVFIDDSYRKDGVFVLAGAASAEKWASFSRQWEELLPVYGVRNKKGRYRFKMAEMASRMQNAPPFHRVIENHAEFSVAFQMRLDDFERTKERVCVDVANLIWQLNPFKFAFRVLLKHFH
jgi:hypothetical protein